MKCDFDPMIYKDEPIGMFHCPQCGEMVLAGVPHPDYDYINKSIDDFINNDTSISHFTEYQKSKI